MADVRRPRVNLAGLTQRWVPPLRRLIEQRDQLLRQRDKARDRNHRLRRRNAALQSELDVLRTNQVGDLDQLGYVFIITYGRSGSTLLQGILNSIPGYTIHGENHSVLRGLYQYQKSLETQSSRRFDPKRPLPVTHAWYGIDQFQAEDSLQLLRTAFTSSVLRPTPETRVAGFKEIRWFYPDWKEYLDFLTRLFPTAKFVINNRDHEGVAQSKWWAENVEAMKKLDRYESMLDGMAAQLGERVYRVRYDDYVSDHNVLRGLFDWLGEPFDLPTIDAVMAERHSTSKR